MGAKAGKEAASKEIFFKFQQAISKINWGEFWSKQSPSDIAALNTLALCVWHANKMHGVGGPSSGGGGGGSDLMQVRHKNFKILPKLIDTIFGHFMMMTYL